LASENISGIIKLSQNENPFGPSPRAVQALSKHHDTIFRYPPLFHQDLAEKLAGRFERQPENITLSAGSVELVDVIIKSFVGEGENVVTSDVTFVAYPLLSKILGRECRRAPMVNFTNSPSDLAEACDERTKVVFIANPNNPTGTIISHSQLEAFLGAVPATTKVVIDDAYAEYVTDATYPDSLALQEKFDNLIVLRTFSKIYGLAGLRIGYAISSPDVIQVLRAHRTPFTVTRLAAVAASAAMDDSDYTGECAGVNDRERALLFEKFRDMGLTTVPTHGNFMYVEFSDADEKLRVLNSLAKEDILVRDMGPFGAQGGLRISVGRPEENRKLVDSLSRLAAR